MVRLVDNSSMLGASHRIIDYNVLKHEPWVFAPSYVSVTIDTLTVVGISTVGWGCVGWGGLLGPMSFPLRVSIP